MVNVDGKPSRRACNTGIPGRVIDRAIQVIHSRRVALGLGLLSEDRCIEEDVRDVTEFVVLHVNLVLLLHHGHNYRFSDLVD